MQDLWEVSRRLEGCACSNGTSSLGLTWKTSHTHTPNHTDIDNTADSRWWWKVIFCQGLLKWPTTRQQENVRAPLVTQGKNSLGAQHAPRGGRVGLVHLEGNRDPQYNGALSVLMRLPRLPRHNNSRAEKSFQAFKGIVQAKMVKMIKFLFFAQKVSSGMGALRPKFLGG